MDREAGDDEVVWPVRFDGTMPIRLPEVADDVVHAECRRLGREALPSHDEHRLGELGERRPLDRLPLRHLDRRDTVPGTEIEDIPRLDAGGIDQPVHDLEVNVDERDGLAGDLIVRGDAGVLPDNVAAIVDCRRHALLPA